MEELDTKVWWRYGYVWFLIAGPLTVIIAGVITAYIAVNSPDPVIDQNYYQHGLDTVSYTHLTLPTICSV